MVTGGDEGTILVMVIKPSSTILPYIPSPFILVLAFLFAYISIFVGINLSLNAFIHIGL